MLFCCMYIIIVYIFPVIVLGIPTYNKINYFFLVLCNVTERYKSEMSLSYTPGHIRNNIEMSLTNMWNMCICRQMSTFISNVGVFFKDFYALALKLVSLFKQILQKPFYWLNGNWCVLIADWDLTTNGWWQLVTRGNDADKKVRKHTLQKYFWNHNIDTWFLLWFPHIEVSNERRGWREQCGQMRLWNNCQKCGTRTV
jgi:hypothetical protein